MEIENTRYCGDRSTPFTIITTTNNVDIRFVSDGSVTSTGFLVIWSATTEPPGTIPPESVSCGQHSATRCGRCPYDPTIPPTGPLGPTIPPNSSFCNGDCTWMDGNLAIGPIGQCVLSVCVGPGPIAPGCGLGLGPSVPCPDPSPPGPGPPVPGPGPSVPGPGPSVPGPGPSVPGPGPSVPGSGPSVPDPGPSVPGSGPSVPGPGPSVPGTGPAAPGPGPAAPGPRIRLVSCGQHYAIDCSQCPYDGDTWVSEGWCNGECHWVDKKCLPITTRTELKHDIIYETNSPTTLPSATASTTTSLSIRFESVLQSATEETTTLESKNIINSPNFPLQYPDNDFQLH